jgi:hypothetical protein
MDKLEKSGKKAHPSPRRSDHGRTLAMTQCAFSPQLFASDVSRRTTFRSLLIANAIFGSGLLRHNARQRQYRPRSGKAQSV